MPQLIPPSPKTPIRNNDLASKSPVTVKRRIDLETVETLDVFSPAEIPIRTEQQQSPAVRRLSRMNKGTTRKYDDHYTGSEYDQLSCVTNQGCADQITVQISDGSDEKFLVANGAFVVGEIVDGIGLLAVPTRSYLVLPGGTMTNQRVGQAIGGPGTSIRK